MPSSLQSLSSASLAPQPPAISSSSFATDSREPVGNRFSDFLGDATARASVRENAPTDVKPAEPAERPKPASTPQRPSKSRKKTRDTSSDDADSGKTEGAAHEEAHPAAAPVDPDAEGSADHETHDASEEAVDDKHAAPEHPKNPSEAASVAAVAAAGAPAPAIEAKPIATPKGEAADTTKGSTKATVKPLQAEAKDAPAAAASTAKPAKGNAAAKGALGGGAAAADGADAADAVDAAEDAAAATDHADAPQEPASSASDDAAPAEAPAAPKPGIKLGGPAITASPAHGLAQASAGAASVPSGDANPSAAGNVADGLPAVPDVSAGDATSALTDLLDPADPDMAPQRSAKAQDDGSDDAMPPPAFTLDAGKSPAHVREGAAPPAPEPTPEARFAEVNHPRILTGLHGELLSNGGSMHLRLDPPELGDLQISVHMRDGMMTAAFQTSNEQATRLLSHSLTDLRSMLESQGVSVEKLHVQQLPREQQTGNDAQHQQQQRPPTQEEQQSARREQQRKEMLQKMWQKLMGGGPVDMVA